MSSPEKPSPSSKRFLTFTNPWFRLFILIGMVAASIALTVVFRSVLLPFILALAVAYVIDPLVTRLHRTLIVPGLNRPLPRWASVITIYLIFFVSVTIFSIYAIPPIVVTIKDSVTTEWPRIQKSVEVWVERSRREIEEERLQRERPLAPAFPDPASDDLSTAGRPIERKVEVVTTQVLVRRYGIAASEWVEREGPKKLKEWGVDNAYQLISNIAVSAFVLLFKTIFLVVIIFMVAAFISIDARGIMGFLYGLFPANFRPDLTELLEEIDTGLSGVVRGQLLICLVNGSLTGLGLWILGIPFALILTIIATCCSLIPVFGTMLSTIPCVLVGTVTPDGVGGYLAGLFMLAWITGIHALEAYYLNPKIIGSHAKIHPVLVLFALIAGEHTYGLIGALLGVPVASILQNFFLFAHKRLAEAYEKQALLEGNVVSSTTPAEVQDLAAREKVLDKIREREIAARKRSQQRKEKRKRKRQKKQKAKEEKTRETRKPGSESSA